MFHTDNGTEFVNKALAEKLREYGIKHSTTPAYHPQANPVERVNRVVKPMISSFVRENHREWDAHLPKFRLAVNSAVHSSTKVSPAFLNFVREPRMPENTINHTTEVEIEPNSTVDWEERMKKLSALRDSVAKNFEEASNRLADYFNKNRRERIFKLGDRVWRKYHVLSSAAQGISAGLAHKYAGNYWIAKVLSPTVYMLANASGKIVAKASVADLKPYDRSSSQENVETRSAVADNAGAR